MSGLFAIFAFIAAALLYWAPFARNRRVRRAAFSANRERVREYLSGARPMPAIAGGMALPAGWRTDHGNFVPTSAGGWSFKINKLPTQGPGGIGRLKRFIIDINFPALTTDATAGGLTTEALYGLISSVTVTSGENNAIWGPDHLTGVEMAMRQYQASAELLPFQDDANGDNPIAPSTGPVSRRFQLIYDYSQIGEIGDEACPPTEALIDGQVEVKLNAFPALLTVGGAPSIRLQSEGYFEPKVKAVARLTTVARPIPSADFALGIQGMVVGLAIVNETGAKVLSPFVAADFTGITVKADSINLVDDVDPLQMRPARYNTDPEVAGSNLQRSFFDVIGGARPYAVNVYPLGPSAGLPMGHIATARTWGVVCKGSGTAFTSMTALITYLSKQTDSETLAQWNQCGCRGEAAVTVENSKADTSTGAPLVNDRLQGFLPIVKKAA